MKITEKKKLFFKILSEYLTPKGYKGYLTGGDPTYVLDEKEIVVSFFFNFFTMGDIGGGLIEITHKCVENIILGVGMPNRSLESYKAGGRYNLTTVVDQIKPISLQLVIIKNEDELIAFAQAFISYFETQGAAFVKKYEHLPNILKEMDRLEAEGKDWNGVLSGMGDRLFRGILISKLCNDPNYQKKFEYCEMKFATVPLLEEWKPYWEKLKTVLPEIEAKYNL